MDTSNIRDSINRILKQRNQMLPSIEQRERALKNREEAVGRAKAGISKLLSLEKEQSRKDKLAYISDFLESLNNTIEGELDRISSLRARFSRDSVCIGVSGMARVGKSTTLQKMSGLTDEQIPTGSRQNVTAVHSIIHNDAKGQPRAVISFLSKEEFIDSYISSLVSDVNSVLPDSSHLNVPRSLSELRNMEIPSTLGNEITSTATDSLKRLHDAKDCIDSYKDYLSASPRVIVLEGDNLVQFKQFVAYPEKDDAKAERAYLAVKGVEIFCTFPSMPGVKLSLVDLPGFGEINEGVAYGHIAALDKNVDHILEILKPQDTSGSITQADGHALDLLYKVQRGINFRKDLITVGINVFDNYAENAHKLEEDFSKRYNAAQDNPLAVELYHANDQDSVFSIFGNILNELAVNLPHMDQELLDEADSQSVSTEFRNGLISARDTLVSLTNSIPLPEKILNDEIQTLSNAIIFACQQFESKLVSLSNTKSTSKVLFNKKVNECKERVENELQEGFFLGMQKWEGRATGRADYYTFYREECRRIRREIIASYEGLDGFYQENTEQFKWCAVNAVFSNMGELFNVLGIVANENADSTIDALYARLASIVRDTGVLPALELLKSVRFSFRHNVFLNIAPHLEELLNPYDRYRSSSFTTEKIIELGGIGDPNRQVDKLREYLTEIGTRANKAVSDALLNSEDRFVEYLSVCMSFFVDYLYRMDESTFRQVFVRKLLTEYPEEIAGKRTGDQRDSKRIEAYSETTALLQGLINGFMSDGGVQTPVKPREKHRSARTPVEQRGVNMDRLAIGEELEGKVTRVIPKVGVFVSIGHEKDGLVPMRNLRSFFNCREIDLSSHFQPGKKIAVRVQAIKEDGKIDLEIVRIS